MPDTVVITGGAGFLGQLLVGQILTAAPDTTVHCVDRLVGADHRATSLVGDMADEPSLLAPLLAHGPCTIFHLASVVSSGAEADWSTAMKVNVDGLIGLIEQCRASAHVHRVVFASSVAVFGGDFTAAPTGDRTKQAPTSTYGTTKAIGELLIDDASRKGFIDGRTARLPTVIIRPGAPNLAASSFCSGIFREPLQGLRCTVPVSTDTGVVVISPETAAANLEALASIDAEQLGSLRGVALPGLTITVADMVDALGRAKPDAVELLDFEFNPAIADIVAGWPSRWDDQRGRELGLAVDTDLDAIIEAFRSRV